MGSATSTSPAGLGQRWRRNTKAFATTFIGTTTAYMRGWPASVEARGPTPTGSRARTSCEHWSILVGLTWRSASTSRRPIPTGQRWHWLPRGIYSRIAAAGCAPDNSRWGRACADGAALMHFTESFAGDQFLLF